MSAPARRLVVIPALAVVAAPAQQAGGVPQLPGQRITRVKDLHLTTELCRGGRPQAVLALPDDGDTVSGVIGMRGAAGPLVACGTEAGWALAIAPEGKVLWSVPLPKPVLRLWRADAANVVAWCQDEDYFLADAAGQVRARGHGSRPAAFLATSSF